MIHVVIYWPKEERAVEDSGLLSIPEHALHLLPLYVIIPLSLEGFFNLECPPSLFLFIETLPLFWRMGTQLSIYVS